MTEQKLSLKLGVGASAAVLALGLVLAGCSTQTSTNTNSTASTSTTTKADTKMMGVKMENGKMMMMMSDGTMKAMDKEMTMTDGTKMMMNGEAMMKNGEKMMMKDGMMMMMDGKMMEPMEMMMMNDKMDSKMMMDGMMKMSDADKKAMMEMMMKDPKMMEMMKGMMGDGMMMEDDGLVNPTVGGAAMSPKMNIVENALNSPIHKTLVAAVKAAGLVDTLMGAGPFTVFAPTDDAFAKLPAGTVDTLVKPENKATLVKILTYHVVPGKLKAADLKDGMTLTTVQGGTLTVMLKDGKVWLKDEKGGLSQVTTANVFQSNGVIHVVDTVLMPK